jgi:molybdopterin-containing oxidoreductase family membrane subunit
LWFSLGWLLPLLWDVFAISTYLSVSLVFWWTGLLPDFAMLRDRLPLSIKSLFYFLSLDGVVELRIGNVLRISLVLAGYPVLSVHTIVSMDFATSVIPGWHTIFRFVAGRSQVCHGKPLLIIMRKVSNLEAYITFATYELMNIVFGGSIVGVAYITEFYCLVLRSRI